MRRPIRQFSCIADKGGHLTITNNYGMFWTEPAVRRGLPLHHTLPAHEWVTGCRCTFGVIHRIMLRAFIAITMALSYASGAAAQDVFNPIRDARIVVNKRAQTLEVHRNGHPTALYRICLGKDPEGPKKTVGDGKTPEGDYFICTKTTASKYCRFLGISYPGEKDAQDAFESGVISRDTRDQIIMRVKNGQPPPWDTKLGGWVGIHGYASDRNRSIWIALFYPKPHNWTDGCIAMWNFEIEDLFSRVRVGTPVTIVP